MRFQITHDGVPFVRDTLSLVLDLIGQWLYDSIHLPFIKNSDSLNPGTFSDSKVGVVVCVSVNVGVSVNIYP